MWKGSAAIILNDQQEILMVYQAAKDEEATWSVPSGEKLCDESYEQCCKREVYEETGYSVCVESIFHLKQDDEKIVKYFICDIESGEMRLNDPDGLIYDIKWISALELSDLQLTYEEDRKLLYSVIRSSK